MGAFTAALASFASASYGIITDAQLAALGLTSSQRRNLVSDGLLVRIFNGVYHVVAVPFTLMSKALAVCAADASAAITGRAGGALWSVRRVGVPDVVEVRVAHGAQGLRAPFVVLRRCSVLDPVDVVERADGIRVVSPPRLAFDLAAELSDEDLESVVEQLIDRRMCSVSTLVRTAQRLCRPARPGSARFQRVIYSRPTAMPAADSDLEVVLFRALVRAGIGGLVRQLPIPLRGRAPVHADLAVPHLRWAIEVDHVTWHGGRLETQRDKQRDRAVRAAGFRVDRVTDLEVEHDLVRLTQELVAIHDTLDRSRTHAGERG